MGNDPSRDHTDALLVAAGRGDLDAFAAFFDRTAPVTFGMLRAALGHPEWAEHAAEDVYLQLWRTAPTFGSTGRSAWATVVAEVLRALSGPVHDLVTSARLESGRCAP